MRWIQAQVNADRVVFKIHAKYLRGPQRGVSPDEAKQAILKGRSANWEPGEDPKTRVPSMNMTFSQKLRIRTIGVVTAISNEWPDVAVITVWQDES